MRRKQRRRRRAIARRRRHQREREMRALGMAMVSALLYALFALAGACAILALVALGGYLTVWRGLDFPLSARVGLSLLGLGVSLAGIGYGVYRVGRRVL